MKFNPKHFIALALIVIHANVHAQKENLPQQDSFHIGNSTTWGLEIFL